MNKMNWGLFVLLFINAFFFTLGVVLFTDRFLPDMVAFFSPTDASMFVSGIFGLSFIVPNELMRSDFKRTREGK